MDKKPIVPNRLFLVILFILGCIEFTAAAIWILRIDPDPKNAFIGGYSLPRMTLFLITILPVLVLLIFARLVWQGKMMSQTGKFFIEKITLVRFAALILVLLSFLIWVTPPVWLGKFGDYYRRAQPLFLVVCSYPFQFSLLMLIGRKLSLDKSLERSLLIFSTAICILGIVILTTGLGITPEEEFTTKITWNNIAGTPLTMFQWFLSLIITLLISSCIVLLLKRNSGFAGWIDICVAWGLYFATALIWAGAPFKESTFASKLIPPFFQPFPRSDAAVHDIGALSILQGQGIAFGGYTDKPFYMSFLAFLHLLAGYDYKLLVVLQIYFLALMAPLLYFLGKSFHSRLLGVLSVLILIFRQRNAILLTNILYYNATPNLLMTEVPTMLGVILLTWCWFAWMRKPRLWIALATGGVLGVISLIRLNPILLLPVIPIFTLLVMGGDKKRWLLYSSGYFLGFILLISPWLFTGTDSSGKSYFLLKFYDVINVRYGTDRLPTNTAPEIASLNPIPYHLDRSTFSLRTLPENDINHFPGFVINNFIHNIVESFLILPDSLNPSHQNLSNLEERFYWTPETFDYSRIPYLILNCFLVAIGLAWSWKRWKWTGMGPLLLFLAYSLSLALGRTSGSRYLIPIDWIVFLYFSIGVLVLVEFFLPSSRFLDNAATPTEAHSKRRWGSLAFPITLLGVILLAMVIPVSDNFVPQNDSLCRNDDLSAIAARYVDSDLIKDMNFRKGIVLYPTIDDKILSFTLLSCSQTTDITMNKPLKRLNSGDMIIIGWRGREPSSDLLIVPFPGASK